MGRAGHPHLEEQAEFLVDLETITGAQVQDFMELGEMIGEGTFGKVYACRCACGALGSEPQGRLCAKVVRRTVAKKLHDPVLRLLWELKHPNIVRYHSFVQTQESLCIIMDRCEGPELPEHVKAHHGMLPCHAVRSIVRQALAAIVAVHTAGLMHRDLKPQNFCFREEIATTLQLIDFGSAVLSGPGPASQSITGTLVYAAPEVFDGFYGSSCDLWSIGVIFFLLIAGHLPFDTPDLSMLQSMHRDPVLTGDSLIRGERWQRAPPGAQSLARGLLTVDPGSRLTGATALKHDWFVENTNGNENGSGAAEDAPGQQAPSTLAASLTRSGCRSLKRSSKHTDLRGSKMLWNLADGINHLDPDEKSINAGQASRTPSANHGLLRREAKS